MAEVHSLHAPTVLYYMHANAWLCQVNLKCKILNIIIILDLFFLQICFQ